MYKEVMAKMGKTSIGWTATIKPDGSIIMGYTWNPWIGCTKCSEGCVNCYAERDNKFYQWNENGWGPGVPRHRTAVANWKKPGRWNKLAKKDDVRYKVFCASLADVFDPEVPIEWLADLLEVIQECRNLDWLLLTKRIEEVDSRISAVTGINSGVWFQSMPHVWLGVTAENQKRADERIPKLLKIPAKLRFISAEPLLENILFDDGVTSWLTCNGKDKIGIVSERHYCCVSEELTGECFHGIDWIITGGESGKAAREMNPDWARSIQAQCEDAKVSFYMKQMSGNTIELRNAIPADLKVQDIPVGLQTIFEGE